MRRLYLALAGVLAVSGCDKPPAQKAQSTAEGEILPGSASDAMLPLDTVRSQAPLAPKPASSGSGDAGLVRPASGQSPSIRPAERAAPAQLEPDDAPQDAEPTPTE